MLIASRPWQKSPQNSESGIRLRTSVLGEYKACLADVRGLTPEARLLFVDFELQGVFEVLLGQLADQELQDLALAFADLAKFDS